MIKQIKIFNAENLEQLENEINTFCVEFFPEEILDVRIKETSNSYIGYVIYQKDEYEE